MQVFPVEALRRLVGLMRSQTDRDGAHAECIVVNPNEHFLMIPLTLGVLKRTDNGSSKVVEFLGLFSIHQFVGVDHDDTDRSGDDSWASCLLPAAVADHDCGLTAAEVSSLRTLSRLKPCYHQASHIPREGVCKELLPTGVARLWDETLRWRQVQGLSTHGLYFVDLGSGIGGVVIATQVLHPTFVTYGVEKDADLHDTTMEWLRAIEHTAPRMQRATRFLETNLINGDFTEDHRVGAILERADVVFCNNLLFDPPGSRQPSAELPLNHKLHDLLCGKLSSVATVVTTSSLFYSRRPNKRGRGQQVHEHVLVNRHQFAFPPSDVSWHGNLSAFISSLSP